MDREFNSIDELHNWADEIAITIGFQFTRVSYKQKKDVLELVCI